MTELQAASAWTPSWMRHHPLWKCILARDDHGHHLSPFKNPGGMHQIRLNMSASSSHYEVWALPRFSANFVVEIKTTLTKKTCDQPVNIHRSYICRKACPLWGIEENFMAKWFQCLAHCSIFLRRVLRLSPPSFEFPLRHHDLVSGVLCRGGSRPQIQSRSGFSGLPSGCFGSTACQEQWWFAAWKVFFLQLCLCPLSDH